MSLDNVLGGSLDKKQVRIPIQFGSGTTIAGGATRYMGLGVNSAADVQVQIIHQNGSIRNLRVYSSGAAGAGETYTYTVRVNNADTTITCSHGGAAAVSSQDLTNGANVSTGDRVSVKVVASGAATANLHAATVEFG